MPELTEILILDDHEVMHAGLTAILETIPNTSVIGAYTSGKQLFEALKTKDPDIIFMDIDLGNENGIDITRKVTAQYKDIQVIAFTSSDEVHTFTDMMDAGAFGFLLKKISKAELVIALNEIKKGNMYFSKEFLMLARQFIPSSPGKRKVKFTERETEVLRLICLGYSNQEIAAEISISAHTVDAHRRSLLAKTSAKNTANLIMISFKEGLLDIE